VPPFPPPPCVLRLPCPSPDLLRTLNRQLLMKTTLPGPAASLKHPINLLTPPPLLSSFDGAWCYSSEERWAQNMGVSENGEGVHGSRSLRAKPHSREPDESEGALKQGRVLLFRTIALRSKSGKKDGQVGQYELVPDKKAILVQMVRGLDG
jgi:hypothetical protein